MIYIVAMKAAKVLAYDGKHWNVIVRLFGTPREKIAQAILAVYLRAFREDETLPMGGYAEYYIVSVKDTHLIRAVARTCLMSKDRDRDINSIIDEYARQIMDWTVIVAYTKVYEEVAPILEQLRKKTSGVSLFYPPNEAAEAPF
jgi:hypothetical protein